MEFRRDLARLGRIPSGYSVGVFSPQSLQNLKCMKTGNGLDVDARYTKVNVQVIGRGVSGEGVAHCSEFILRKRIEGVN